MDETMMTLNKTIDDMLDKIYSVRDTLADLDEESTSEEIACDIDIIRGRLAMAYLAIEELRAKLA